jgi:dinuclear metal center YbgI/SA1388 family protein
MKVRDIIQAIEAFAPSTYQESYDNSGLQVGDMNAAVTGCLLTLDVTEDILKEAMERGCNMVVAHHPVIFSGLKRLTGGNYVQRIVQMAIKNDINIYACHTNIDNMRAGVNAKIAEKLGLVDTRILSPMNGSLSKLYTYAPAHVADKVREAMFAAGAGEIGNYRECSFSTTGTGSYRPNEQANPAIGTAGGPRVTDEEVKIEVLVHRHNEQAVIRAMRESHIYEEVAYELVALQNDNKEMGAGMVGMLPEPMSEMDVLVHIKAQMGANCIKYTQLRGKMVEKIAICGGSGSFLLKDAISAGADVFITADYKYHQFFDAEGQIVIADIGHYESEQYTPELFMEILSEKFPNFAFLLSGISTNPVKYFC